MCDCRSLLPAKQQVQFERLAPTPSAQNHAHAQTLTHAHKKRLRVVRLTRCQNEGLGFAVRGGKCLNSASSREWFQTETILGRARLCKSGRPHGVVYVSLLSLLSCRTHPLTRDPP